MEPFNYDICYIEILEIELFDHLILCKWIVKLVIIVESDPKDPISIATTPRGREGVTFFLGLLQLTLDPYFIMLSVKLGGIMKHFWIWDWTQVSRAIGEHYRWSFELLVVYNNT